MDRELSQADISILKKHKRKSAYEVFFDEEPYFSDTDDEIEFERDLTKHLESPTKYVINSGNVLYARRLYDELIFSDHCNSCKNNKEFMQNLFNMGSERGSVSPSQNFDSGVNSATGSENTDRNRDSEEVELFNDSLHTSFHENHNRKSAKKAAQAVELVNERSIMTDRNSPCNSSETKKSFKEKRNGHSIKRTSRKALWNQEKENESESDENTPLNTLLQEIKKKRKTLELAEANEQFKRPIPRPNIKRRPRAKSVDCRRRTRSECCSIDTIFKVPVGTTSNGNVTKALLRKLCRSTKKHQSLESVNKDEEPLAFRSFQTTHRLRKLYSPDDWVNSREFSTMATSKPC